VPIHLRASAPTGSFSHCVSNRISEEPAFQPQIAVDEARTEEIKLSFRDEYRVDWPMILRRNCEPVVVVEAKQGMFSGSDRHPGVSDINSESFRLTQYSAERIPKSRRFPTSSWLNATAAGQTSRRSNKAPGSFSYLFGSFEFYGEIAPYITGLVRLLFATNYRRGQEGQYMAAIPASLEIVPPQGCGVVECIEKYPARSLLSVSDCRHGCGMDAIANCLSKRETQSNPRSLHSGGFDRLRVLFRHW
jgi:hypothetical protein